MTLSRADRSRLTDWWFTVDRALLSAILILVAIGMVLSLAASPAVALKKGLSAYHFVERHIAFSALALMLMLTLSFLTPRETRRAALGLLVIAIVGLLAVHVLGREINGARRWLSIGGHSVQPSEFLKPAFVVISAWLLVEARKRPDMPALILAIGLFIPVAALLVLQPDVGQTFLIALVWGAMFIVSGQRLGRAAAVLALGAVGLVAAYLTFPHVTARVDRFLNPMPGDNSQIDRALQSFAQGGFFGRGPGEGTIKTVLPDAHTDFIFAVVAEEYGVLACLVLVFLYGFIVLRALYRAGRVRDPGVRLTIIGLALVFGLQALINMGVNAGLLPAKGITLPFLSAGGSSMLAVSVTLGMLLAMTRHRVELIP